MVSSVLVGEHIIGVACVVSLDVINISSIPSEPKDLERLIRLVIFVVCIAISPPDEANEFSDAVLSLVDVMLDVVFDSRLGDVTTLVSETEHCPVVVGVAKVFKSELDKL